MSFLVFNNFSYPERFASQSKPSTQWKLQPHLQRDNNSKPKKKEGKRWGEIEEKKEWRGRFVSTLHAWACLFDHVEFQPFRWLECVGQASNAFPRHHHNSRHSWGSAGCGDICTTTLVTSSPPPPPHPVFPSAHNPAETNTHTHTQTLTHAHTLSTSPAKCQRGESEGHQRWLLSAYTHVWVCVNGTQGWGGLWYHRVHINWPARVCHDGWRVERVTNPRFSTRTTPWHSTQACYTTVTWVGQVTFEPFWALSYVPIVPWILYQFHTSAQYGSHWVPIQSLVLSQN